jgi:metal-responsive CopG/Arc/MetJ family transcriptional regulator
MRVKTSVTLTQDLLERLDRVDKNRSALLERAARSYLARLEKAGRDRRDLDIIDRNADRLNREAMDALEYQQRPRREASCTWFANRDLKIPRNRASPLW